jgi:hypothetical protein
LVVVAVGVKVVEQTLGAQVVDLVMGQEEILDLTLEMD